MPLDLEADRTNDDVAVESWTYDPRKLATDGFVDRLSLYLTLKHVPDERVQQALAHMLAEVRW